MPNYLFLCKIRGNIECNCNLWKERTNHKNCKETLPRKVLVHLNSSMAGKDQKLEKISKIQ